MTACDRGAALALALLFALIAPASAQQPYDPAKADPEDFAAVKQVCTACHDTSRVMHSRPWSDWLRVLGWMSDMGAKGSDEQWDKISRFLLRNLSTLNVNTAPAEEIGPVLDINEATVAAILARRDEHKFTGVYDLQSVAHIAPDRLANVTPRLSF